MPWGVRYPVVWDDDLVTFICWRSRNSGILNFESLQALSRPVYRLLYLSLCWAELQGTVSSIAVSVFWNLNYVLSKFLLFNFEIIVSIKKTLFVFVQKTGNINYCCTDKIETFEVCWLEAFTLKNAKSNQKQFI